MSIQAVEEIQKVRDSVKVSIILFKTLENNEASMVIEGLQNVYDILDNDIKHYQLTKDSQRFMQNIAYTENFLRKHSKGGEGMIVTFYMGIVEQVRLIVERYTTSTTRHDFDGFFDNHQKYEYEKQYNLRHLREGIRQSQGYLIQVLRKNGSYMDMYYSNQSGKSMAVKDNETIEVYRDYGLDEAQYREK